MTYFVFTYTGFLFLGEVSIGDRILHVNGYSLKDVTQLEAISYLRLAAQSGAVLLVLDKSESAQ